MLQYTVKDYIFIANISNAGETTTIRTKAHWSLAKSERPHELPPECNKSTTMWNSNVLALLSKFAKSNKV